MLLLLIIANVTTTATFFLISNSRLALLIGSFIYLIFIGIHSILKGCHLNVESHYVADLQTKKVINLYDL